jgi:membrane protein required for colicin V production
LALPPFSRCYNPTSVFFDIAVVGIVVLALLHGAWKGLAWQLAGIFSLIAGFGVGLPLSAPLAHFFGSSAPLNRFIAVAVVYALVSLGIYLAAFYYREAIQKWKLDNWDRHLGGLLGAIKGYLLCLVLTFFAITLFSGLRDPILSRPTGKLMAYTMHSVHPVWPAGFHSIIHSYIEHDEEPAEAAPPPPSAPPSK